jgi:hypothetical protein
MSRNVSDRNDQRNMSRETQSSRIEPQSATPQRGVSNIAARLLAFVLLAVAFASLPAYAEDELPGRVGRIANVQGVLRHTPGDSAEEWAEIGLNYPIAEGHNLWVEHDGRAEVDYGGGQFRLAGDTNVHVSRLDDRQLALFIASGRMIVRIRVLERDDSARIDTPATQIELTRPGLYRIDVAQDAPLTTLVVREGEAQVYAAGAAEQVLPGQTATLTGVASEAPDIRVSGGIDGFDAWSAARDRVYEQPRQYAYVSRQMVGAADLNTYGTWQLYPDYGAVWFPTDVSPAWAPYRHGYWTWLPGWGYTWVDSAPWGYAPFHYGRWAFIGGRWGWCPGAFVARPLWAPALVAWYGGGRWALTATGGPVYGWTPLGWREPYVPWWGTCSARCWARYNHPFGLNVAERRDVPPSHYVNARAPGGITAVSGTTLATGTPVAPHRVSVSSGVDVGASLLPTAPQVKPIAPALANVRPSTNVPPPASVLARSMQAAPRTGPNDRRDVNRRVYEPIAPVDPRLGAAGTRDATLPAATGSNIAPVPPQVMPRAPSTERGRVAQNLPAPVPPPASSAVGTSPDPAATRQPRIATPSEDPASRIAPVRPHDRARDVGPLPRAVPPASAALPAPTQAPVVPAPRVVPAPVAPVTPVPRSVPVPAPVSPAPIPGMITPGVPPGAVTPGPIPGVAPPAASPPAPRTPVRPVPNPGPDR